MTKQRSKLPRSVWITIILVGSVALVVAVLQLHSCLTKKKPPPSPALKRWTVPGATIMLPQWRLVRDERAEVRGELKVVPPGRAGRKNGSVRLAWSPAKDTLSEATVLEYYKKKLEFVRRDTRTLSAGQEPATLWYFERANDTMQLVVVRWSCGADALAYELHLYLDWQKKRLIRLAGKILETFECRPEVPIPRPSDFVVRFRPPPGYQFASNESAFVYEGPEKDVYLISRGVRVSKETTKDKSLVPIMLRQILPKALKIEARPAVEGDSQQGLRRVIRARGRDSDGVEQRLLFTLLHCPRVGRTYFGAHLRRPSQSEADHAQRLSRLKCP